MLNPQYRILIRIQARQKRTLKTVHEFVFYLCRQISLCKGQHARGIFLGISATINQRHNLLRIPSKQFGINPSPILTQQVINRP